MAFPCICINLALIFHQIGTKTFYPLLHQSSITNTSRISMPWRICNGKFEESFWPGKETGPIRFPAVLCTPGFCIGFGWRRPGRKISLNLRLFLVYTTTLCVFKKFKEIILTHLQRQDPIMNTSRISVLWTPTNGKFPLYLWQPCAYLIDIKENFAPSTTSKSKVYKRKACSTFPSLE